MISGTSTAYALWSVKLEYTYTPAKKSSDAEVVRRKKARLLPSQSGAMICIYKTCGAFYMRLFSPCLSIYPSVVRPSVQGAVAIKMPDFLPSWEARVSRWGRRHGWHGMMHSWLPCSALQPAQSLSIKDGTWLREFTSCSCLTFLPCPAWVLL